MRKSIVEKTSKYIPHYPAVYHKALTQYDWAARQRVTAWFRRWSIDAFDGFLETLQCLKKAGILKPETVQKIGEDLLAAKKAVDMHISVGKRTYAQNECCWRFWKVVHEFGAI